MSIYSSPSSVNDDPPYNNSSSNTSSNNRLSVDDMMSSLVNDAAVDHRPSKKACFKDPKTEKPNKHSLNSWLKGSDEDGCARGEVSPLYRILKGSSKKMQRKLQLNFGTGNTEIDKETRAHLQRMKTTTVCRCAVACPTASSSNLADPHAWPCQVVYGHFSKVDEMASSHSTKITIDRLGDFVPIDSPLETISGLNSSSPNSLSEIPFICSDPFNVLPDSTPPLRCCTPCCGVGIDAKSCNLCNFVVVAAADICRDSRSKFSSSLGFDPHHSNDKMFKSLSEDVVAFSFGTSCTSVSSVGKQQGLAKVGDWKVFSRIVKEMGDRKILCFHFENVPGLLDDMPVKSFVFSAFKEAGYVLVFKVLNAANFGTGVSRQRLHVIGMRESEALCIGFGELSLPGAPIDFRMIRRRVISDFVNRKDPIGSDVVELDSWMSTENESCAEDRKWCITWCQGFGPSRNDVSRQMRERADRADEFALVLGYVVRSGSDPMNQRYTGFKIISSLGVLSGLTHSNCGEGPGKNQPLVFFTADTNGIRTLGDDVLRKMWWSTHNPDLVARDLGNTAHPSTSICALTILRLAVHKLFVIRQRIGRWPRVFFKSISDVLTPDCLFRFTQYTKKVVTWSRQVTKSFSESGEYRGRGAPIFTSSGSDVQPFARGYYFDLRPCYKNQPPLRLLRRSGAVSMINLSNLPYMKGYFDRVISTIARDIGFYCGANPVPRIVVVPNGTNCFEHADVFNSSMKTEIECGWMETCPGIPFYPMYGSNNFMLQQGEKWRRIFNVSREVLGVSINSQELAMASARMELVTHDWIARAVCQLCEKAVWLNSLGVSVDVMLFVVDLTHAYNQWAIGIEDLWKFCSSWVDEDSKYHSIVNLRLGFGPKKAPSMFARITSAVHYSIERIFHHAPAWVYPLQSRFRQLLVERGITDVSTLQNDREVAPRPTTASSRRKALEDECAKVNREAGGSAWRGLKNLNGLSSSIQVVAPPPACSRDDPTDAFFLATYLDDTFGGAIELSSNERGVLTPLRLGTRSSSRSGKRAWTGGATSSNVDRAMSKFLKRKPGAVARAKAAMGPSGVAPKPQFGRNVCVDDLRESLVRKPIEAAGLAVVDDVKSEQKHAKGKASQVKTILGFEYDTSDPKNPSRRLPDAKRSELAELTSHLHRERPGSVQVDETLTLASKLSNASMVVRGGRTYCCGLFAILNNERIGAESDHVAVTAWFRRNVDWWHRFFESGAPCSFLMSQRIFLEKKFCPHSDACTGWGYGGFWIKNDVCYYIQGEWTDDEKVLIETSKTSGKENLSINFLEMATVRMLLSAAEANFQDSAFTFYCDNAVTVSILNSTKTRTHSLSTLLEAIDLHTLINRLTINYEWLASEINIESDLLSRGYKFLTKFMIHVKRTYNIHTFTKVAVPQEARDFMHEFEAFTRNQDHLSVEGDVRTTWPGGGD